MAGKKSFDFDDWTDFDDFDDYNVGSGQGDFKSTTKTGKAREAVTALGGGFVSGVKDALFTRGFYQKVVTSALPDEYDTGLTAVLNTKDSVSDLYDTAVRESADVNDKLTKGVKPFVDKYSDKLPLRLKGPLRRWTSNVRGTNEWTAENKDELDSVATINDIFSKREQTRSLKNTSVHSQVQTGIAKGQLTLTEILVDNQNRQLAYQDQIDATWKRKTLELQYKQFFVQRKLLDVQEQSLKLSLKSYGDIITNTALPDFVKATKHEIAGRVVTERLFGAALDSFSGMPYDVISRLSRNLMKKITSGSRDIQEGLSSGLEQLYESSETASMGAEDLGERGRARVAGQNAAGGALSMLIGRVGKKLKPKLEGNENVKFGADLLAGHGSRLPRIMNSMLDNGTTNNGFLDMMIELTDAREVFASNHGTIAKNNSQDLDTKVYFDLLSKKSLTEIIPGYLTRIHHEIRSLRTGDDSQPMVNYDFEKGVFSNDSVISRRLKEKTVGSYNRQSLKASHDKISESLDLDNNLTEGTRTAFLKELSMASINNKDFTLKSLLGQENTALTPEQRDELADFIKNKFNIDYNTSDDDELNPRGFLDTLKAKSAEIKNLSPEAAKAQRDILDMLNSLKRNLVNPTAALNQSARRGQLSNATELNFVTEHNGNYSVDYSSWIDELMSPGTNETDESGDWEDKSKAKEDSATRKYLNEQADKIKNRFKRKSDTDVEEDDTDESPTRRPGVSSLTRDEFKDLWNLLRNGDETVDDENHDDDSDNRVFNPLAVLNKLQDKIKTASVTTVNPLKQLPKNLNELTELLQRGTPVEEPVAESPNDIERKKRWYTSLISNKKLAEYKVKYRTNDKIQSLIDRVKKHAGKTDISTDDVLSAYGDDIEVRKLVDEIEIDSPTPVPLKSKVSEVLDQVKPTVSAKFDQVKTSITTSVTDALPEIKERISGPSEPEVSDKDIADASAYADDIIEKNQIEDSTLQVRRALIKAYLKDVIKDKLIGRRGYSTMVKTGEKIQSTKDSAIQSVNKLKSIGVKTADEYNSTELKNNPTSVLKLLFDLSRYAVKAGEIATRPSRAILKMIPWGLKKIMGTLVDTVNFGHVQHGLWLAGEKEPRLLRTGLMSGRYINGAGKVVVAPKDIVGDIFDGLTTPHELVMSASEYKKGLYDSTGKLIFKPKSIAGKIIGGIAAAPFKLAKTVTKAAGKLFMGYLNVTTRPVTWLINRIMREDRIEPKLHAELVHLGLTEQTNNGINELTALIDKRLPEPADEKFNDKDKDGDRDGGVADVIETRNKKKEVEEEKKKSRRSLFNRDKKKKDGEDDSDGMGVLGLLGRAGGFFGRAAGLIKNPYVLGGVALASLLGWEFLSDGTKNADEDDIANVALPDSLKDDKAARMGIRLTEKIVDLLVLGPIKNNVNAVIKAGRLTSRLAKWSGRKLVRGLENVGGWLGDIPGATAGFLFGKRARKAVDSLMQIDNVNPLFRFRMAQYGFDYNDKAGVNAILKLEDDILSELIEATDTAPAAISNKITIEQSASYFGVSINSEQNMAEWVSWFKYRFRPVFLSNVTILKRGGHSGKLLHEVDSKLTKPEKLDFINKINFYRIVDNPYDVPTSPIGSASTLDVIGNKDVSEYREENINVIKEMPDDAEGAKKVSERAAKRDGKRLDTAKDVLKNVKAAKRKDWVKDIDAVTFKSFFTPKEDKAKTGNVDKGLDGKPVPKEGGKFSGAGAGSTIEKAEVVQTQREAEAKVIKAENMEKHGAVGEMLSGVGNAIGSVFVSKAHASAFLPEAQGKAPVNTPVNPVAALKTQLDAAAAKPNSLLPVASKGPSTNLSKAGITSVATTTAVTANAVIPVLPFKPNVQAGSTALGINDKPMATIRHLRALARPAPAGNASAHLKEALNKAGYSFKAPAAACDYPAKALPDMGYAKIDSNATWMVGDIMVYGSNKEYKYGHIQMFDGANWISDHVQENVNPFGAGAPSFTVWRDLKFSIQSDHAPNTTFKKKAIANTDELSNLTVDDKGNFVRANGKVKSKDKEKSKEEKPGIINRAWNATKETASSAWDKVTEVGASIADSIKNALAGSGNNGDEGSSSSSSGGPEYHGTGNSSKDAAAYQLMVYRAFKVAGFSEQQARILTAEIGRENSYQGKWLFGGHKDPHSGNNIGMLSWQKGRYTALIKWLKPKGLVKTATTLVKSQECLNEQAKFLMHEMANDPDYKYTKKNFLDKPNISYKDGVWVVGKYFIRWRITDPKYYASGARRRDNHYNDLLRQLGVKDGDGISKNVVSSKESASKKKSKVAPGHEKTNGNVLAMVTGQKVPKKTSSVTPGHEKTNGNVLATVTGQKSNTTKPHPNDVTSSTPATNARVDSGVKSAVGANTKPALAAAHCTRAASARSRGECAKYVRMALQKAKYSFTPVPSAYQYASMGILSKMGFGQISTSTTFQVGDIVVINRTSRHPHGHICIYNGSIWVSDFRQNGWNVYSGPQSYTLWRDRDYLNGAAASSGPTSAAAGAGKTNGANGGGGTESSGAGGTTVATEPQYTKAKMEYKVSTGVDERIKKTWNDRKAGVKSNYAIAKEAEHKAAKAAEQAESLVSDGGADDGVVVPAAKTNTTATKAPAPSKNLTIPNVPTAANVSSPLTWKSSGFAPAGFGTDEHIPPVVPDYSFSANRDKPVDKPFVPVPGKVNVYDEVTPKSMTERMSQTAANQATIDLAESNKYLKDSLHVQRAMLSKMTAIEEHLIAVSKRKVERNVVESSTPNPQPSKSEKTAPKASTYTPVNRPTRDEPMSMSKML